MLDVKYRKSIRNSIWIWWKSFRRDSPEFIRKLCIFMPMFRTFGWAPLQGSNFFFGKSIDCKISCQLDLWNILSFELYFKLFVEPWGGPIHRSETPA
jgi:hypothetical protein